MPPRCFGKASNENKGFKYNMLPELLVMAA